MTHDPTRHHRRSIRLPSYDDAQAGAYFVTMVAHQRQCLFGEIAGGQMELAACGEILSQEWERSGVIRGEVELDAFVVMPNHVHGIGIIRDQPIVGAHGRAPLRDAPLCRAPRSLGSFVAGFKSAATGRINEMRGTPGLPVWQRNYYEHIIHNETDLNDVRQYIVDNPLRWAEDRENSANTNVGAHVRAPLRGV